MLKEDPNTIIPVTMQKFSDDGLVPTVFEVDYRIGNSDWKLQVFPNG